MIHCKFRYQYIDLEKREPSNFECLELPLPSGFCIFHDTEYHKEYPDIVCKGIGRKFVLTVGHKLYLIGYNIPHLRVKDSGFSKSVYFTKSRVVGRITFENCNFKKVDFSYAEFKEASFERVLFLDKADFVNSKFQDSIRFWSTNFEDDANFTEAEFGDVDFVNVTFQHEAVFHGSKFQRKVNFGVRKIIGKADFTYTEFQDTTIFLKNEFCGMADFSYSVFYGKTNFILAKFHGETKFYDVVFEDQEKVVFDIENLWKVSFKGTDITRVKFTEKVIWGKNPKERFKLIDEVYLEQSLLPLFDWNEVPGKDEEKVKKYLKEFLMLEWINNNIKIKKETDDKITISSLDIKNKNSLLIQLDQAKHIATVRDNNILLSVFTVRETHRNIFTPKKRRNRLDVYAYAGGSIRGVMAIYRNLRENYEYRLRYDEAGEFFKREMELKRKYREIYSPTDIEIKVNGRLRRNVFSLTGWYHILSDYGESLYRPVVVSVLIIILFTLIWSGLSILSKDHLTTKSGAIFSLIDLDNISKAFQRSIIDFIPFIPLGNQAHNSDYFLRIVGIVGLGLFAIALRRKFERKFRH